MPRILLIGTGSGGHIMPVIAVARVLEEMAPEAKVDIVCSDRAEERTMLEAAGLRPIAVLPLLRRGWGLPGQLARNVRNARWLLNDLHPDVVFSKGGSTGIPLCILASKQGIPVILHESDAVMGRANRFLSRWAKEVCTGNPVRPEMMRGKREEGLRLTELKGDRPILLVAGGSQGSVALNDAVSKHIDALLELCDVIHLTGKGKPGAPPQPGYWSTPFAQKELADLYACASLALSRSGAGAIAELAANQIPMILVPLRGVAQDHQLANARSMEKNGGCIFLEQERLDPMLVPTVQDLLDDEPKRTILAQRAHQAAIPDAARRIAEIIVKNIAHGRGNA